MIELNHIAYKIDNFAIDDISMQLKSGAFHVLLGPTGSGKTMVLELIAGLEKPHNGTIYVNNRNLTHLPPEHRGIAYLPQDIALFPHLSVYHNIAYGLRITKKSDPLQVEGRIKKLTEALGIEHLLHRGTNGLSGGEKQRIALARALAVHKSVLLLDEPTTAVHETMQEELCFYLLKIQKQFGLTILMTTHHKDSAFLVADTIHFIDGGKLYLSTVKEDIYDKPIAENVARYFGINNIFELEVTKISNNMIEAPCSILNTTLWLSGKKFGEQQGRFKIGLRPEEIRMVKDESKKQEGANRFDAKVLSVHFKESNAIIFLEPVGTANVITMAISIYFLKKYNIAKDAVITCKINEQYVRLVF